MLLFQKSVTEGALSLLFFCAKLGDLVHVADGKEKEEASLLLDLLTPIAKSYPSEMCCLTTSAAVQILGGAGYTSNITARQASNPSTKGRQGFMEWILWVEKY